MYLSDWLVQSRLPFQVCFLQSRKKEKEEPCYRMCHGGVMPIWFVPIAFVIGTASVVPRTFASANKKLGAGLSRLKIPREKLLEDVTTPGIFFHRALLQCATGAFDEAQHELEECHRLLRKGVRPDDLVLGDAFVLYLLGYTLDAQGKWLEAVTHLDGAMAIMRRWKNASKKSTATCKHDFRVKSFTKPTFCCKCKMMLIGLTKQGKV